MLYDRDEDKEEQLQQKLTLEKSRCTKGLFAKNCCYVNFDHTPILMSWHYYCCFYRQSGLVQFQYALTNNAHDMQLNHVVVKQLHPVELC